MTVLHASFRAFGASYITLDPPFSKPWIRPWRESLLTGRRESLLTGKSKKVVVQGNEIVHLFIYDTMLYSTIRTTASLMKIYHRDPW